MHAGDEEVNDSPIEQNQLSVGSISAQIIVLPLGKLMAATLPSKPIRVPLTKWTFSMNPGPFNLKEHVLITIFANCGAGEKHRNLFILFDEIQLLGYGWAGLFRKYLVDSPFMWWPANLVQVSLFRALHEKEKRPKGGLTRLQFFFMVFASSFAYYVVPGYLFPTLSALSFVCWIWKNSVTAQQIGAGLNGLGIGSFGLDWSTVASFLGSPLASPVFAIINVLAGFILNLYVLVPIAYWTNTYEAKRFPIFSSHTFDSTGQPYNISRILNEATFDLDHDAFNSYSKLYLSPFFAFNYGLSFATLTATISHVALFDGSDIWQMWKRTTSAARDKFADVHTRLMKKHYEAVPQWWFHIILVATVALSIYACEGFDKQLQLPWPLANVAFKTYGYISMSQALSFLADFKLGHYMKIPPKSMFLVQLIGTVVASSVYFGTAWWLLTSVEHICDPSALPEGSPWTCPGDDVFYSASIIWGIVGTGNMPPARAVHYLSWAAVGIFFNYYVYRRFKGWWARHTYILSAALDAGVAFMGVFLFLTLQSYDIFGPHWWGLDSTDHCPLATCPTAPGIVIEGCPVF
ncbi:hypothetical protein CISIN_1g037647mg [Citrus sinensis]|uniref:Uncharacterized protein n=1 Tax=Citrus sinensis TaxID=2711 RepID=A0A067F7Q8_CITSI|nr:hypothetical protein CISIN_1g037647mg [Citrus sinensis]